MFLALAAGFVMSACDSKSSTDGALYVNDLEREPTGLMEEDGLVVRNPMRRVEVTHVILRKDTEDDEILWLELHMREYLDSGDFYVCESVPERRTGRQFYTRDSEYHEEGCKWAHRFDDVDAARESMRKLTTAYQLDGGKAKDLTLDQ